MNGFSWVQGIQRLTSGDGLRVEVLRGGAGSLLVKAGHAVLAFAVAVLLARTLGPEGYGVYSFALAIIMLAAIPAQVGVPQLVVRETAKAQAHGNYGLMRGLWRWANVAVALFSVLALAAVGGVAWFTDIGVDNARVATLLSGIALIPVIALANVRGACLRGLRKVVQGQLPESIIRPALLLFLVLVWGTWLVEDELSPQKAMGFYVLAAVLAFIIGAGLLHCSRPAELSKRPTPEYHSSVWRKAVIPLAMITGLQLINSYADLIVLGIFRSDEEVGVYRAVFQVALLVIFGLQAMNQVLQPHFARLHEQGDREKLQRVVTISARAILALALPPVLIFIVFGTDLLGWVFGEAFRTGGAALAILAIGQLFSAGLGPVGVLLNMTGNEADSVRALMIVATTNVILNFLLVPLFGMVGAAVATALAVIFLNILLRRRVGMRLGIEATAFIRS